MRTLNESLVPLRWKLKLLGHFCKILTHSVNVSFVSGAKEAPRGLVLMKVSMNESCYIHIGLQLIPSLTITCLPRGTGSQTAFYVRARDSCHIPSATFSALVFIRVRAIKCGLLS